MTLRRAHLVSSVVAAISIGANIGNISFNCGSIYESGGKIDGMNAFALIVGLILLGMKARVDKRQHFFWKFEYTRVYQLEQEIKRHGIDERTL